MAYPTVKLTAYNMSRETTEQDFSDWCSYVSDHIDDACGFDVDVDSFDFTGRGAGGDDDVIDGATDEQRETIREALRSMWDSGCADNFGQPRAQS